jgi:hypothetical protein
MVNLIGVKMIDFLKGFAIFAGVILAFFFGRLKSENKRLEGDLENKESEIKGINETQERIAKYDNTPTSDKRSWLRSRTK